MSLCNYQWKQYNVTKNIPCPPINAVFISNGNVMIEKNVRGTGKEQVEHIYCIYQCLERMEWIQCGFISSLRFNALITEIYEIYIQSVAVDRTLSSPNIELSYFIAHHLKSLPKKYNTKILISYQLLTQLWTTYTSEINKCCPYLRHIINNNNKIFKVDYNKHFTIKPIEIDEKTYDENNNNNGNNKNKNNNGTTG
eukprot:217487_1